jgi:AraC family transcriptional regulator
MRLNSGEFFGRSVWQQRKSGLNLTLSTYRPGPTQPRHRHVNPTLFLLLGGEHRDHSRDGHVDQPLLTLVYHPTTYVHASEYGSRGMRGLNIEFEVDWLELNELRDHDLGDYSLLDSAQAALGALRLLVYAVQPGVQHDADLETQALELLEPLVSRPRHSDYSGEPRWLRSAEAFLRARFRESVSLRDAAREVGVHPVHLARVFRRRHGCPVSKYLRNLRLVEASRLVMDGASLAQASLAAGFADQPHFSRSFSAAVGLSPKRLWPARASLRS